VPQIRGYGLGFSLYADLGTSGVEGAAPIISKAIELVDIPAGFRV
jgi:hypothetical protein